MKKPGAAPLGPPPGSTWPLPRIRVPSGFTGVRLNRAAYPDPAYFGTAAQWRYDAPDASYGVCYIGQNLECAFAETLFDTFRTRDAVHHWWIPHSVLASYYAARVEVVDDIILANLSGTGLGKLGIDLRNTSGDDYDLPQQWSLSIYHHDAMVDGIFYVSRHNQNLKSIALFDRGRGKVKFSVWGTLTDRRTPTLYQAVGRVLRKYEIKIDMHM